MHRAMEEFERSPDFAKFRAEWTGTRVTNFSQEPPLKFDPIAPPKSRVESAFAYRRTSYAFSGALIALILFVIWFRRAVG